MILLKKLVLVRHYRTQLLWQRLEKFLLFVQVVVVIRHYLLRV
jgi:hypothetical protein